MAASFRRAHPDLVVLVDRFPATAGAQAELASGRADVVIGTGAEGERLGWRALALGADAALKIQSLSTADLARIYRQQVTLWSDVGGYPAVPITPVDRAAGDPDHDAFAAAVLGGSAAPVNNAFVVPDDAAAAQALGRPGSIVYLGLRALTGAAVALDGVPCTPATVRAGAWRLVQPIRARAAGGSGSRYPSDFVSYARSPAGQAIVDKHEVGL